MNRSFFKAFCSSLIFSIIFSLALQACRFEESPSRGTNPCIRLQFTSSVNRFIVLCPNASLVPDPYGRIIPIPCAKIGVFDIIHDAGLAGDLEDTAGPQFCYYGQAKNRWPDFYRMHSYVSSAGNTCEQSDYQPPVILLPPVPEELSGFLPETQVLTPEGLLQIGLLKEGDWVVSYDFENGRWENTLIIKVKTTRPINACVCVSNGIVPILAGEDQKFYLAKEDVWVCAKDLTPEKLLMRRIEGQEKKFDLVSSKPEIFFTENPKEAQPLICLTLEKHQNFCVGEGIVAHNCTHEFINGFAVPVFCGKEYFKEGVLDNGDQFRCSIMCRDRNRDESGWERKTYRKNQSFSTCKRESCVTYTKDVVSPFQVEQKIYFADAKARTSDYVNRQEFSENTLISCPITKNSPIPKAVPIDAKEWERVVELKNQGPSNFSSSSSFSCSSSSLGGLSKKQAQRLQQFWNHYKNDFQYQLNKDAQLRQAAYEKFLKEAEQRFQTLVQKARELSVQRQKEIGDLCRRNNKFILEQEFQQQFKDPSIVEQNFQPLEIPQAVHLLQNVLSDNKCDPASLKDQQQIEELELDVLRDVYQTFKKVNGSTDRNQVQGISDRIFLLALGKGLAKAFTLKSLDAGQAVANACMALIGTVLAQATAGCTGVL